jgi:hypothetical protein
VAIARGALGETAKIPLVDALLYWIDVHDLGAALEQAGILKPSYGTIVTPKEMTERLLSVLEENLARTRGL